MRLDPVAVLFYKVFPAWTYLHCLAAVARWLTAVRRLRRRPCPVDGAPTRPALNPTYQEWTPLLSLGNESAADGSDEPTANRLVAAHDRTDGDQLSPGIGRTIPEPLRGVAFGDDICVRPQQAHHNQKGEP